MAKIVGGDLSYVELRKTMTGRLKYVKTGWLARYKPSEIAGVEHLAQGSSVSVAGAAGGVAAGALVAGPVGAVVGGVLAGRRSGTTLRVTFTDGKSTVLECSAREASLLMAAA